MSGVQLQPSSVLLDVAGAVATLTVNRPRVLNALDRATFDALEETLNRIETDPGVRCAIVTGAGDRAFSAGADIRQLNELSSEGALAFMAYGQRLFDRIAQAEHKAIQEVRALAVDLALDATRRLIEQGVTSSGAKADAMIDAAIKELPTHLH